MNRVIKLARRNSAQRHIIEEILGQLEHPTAMEVYEAIRKYYPQISLGTVYRNLGLMAEDGQVLRLSFANAPDRFDPKTEEHYHVVCNRCGRLFDTDHTLPPDLIEKIDSAVEECTGVRIYNRTMMFGGICMECRTSIKS